MTESSVHCVEGRIHHHLVLRARFCIDHSAHHQSESDVVCPASTCEIPPVRLLQMALLVADFGTRVDLEVILVV